MNQITIPDKLWVRLYAGLGDFYKRYFNHITWQCIEDLKTKHPETSIHCVCVSQTIPALDIVDYHPYLDKVIKPRLHVKDFKKINIIKYMGEYQFLSPGIAKRFELKIPPIYLSKEDEKFVNEIKSKYKKYICIHPFAGDKHTLDSRAPLETKEYIPIINKLIDSGYYVLMLGKSWDRILQNKNGKIITIKESFNWSRPGFVNMIDKTNVRTAAALIKNSNGFVGTTSSFMCASWSMGGTKTTIIVPEKWRVAVENSRWAKDKIGDPNHQLLYLNHDRSSKKLEEIANATAKWF